MLTLANDSYLESVSSAIIESVRPLVGDTLHVVTKIIRQATEDELPLMDDIEMEEILYRGSLYDAAFIKQRGPCTTIRMVLRQR